MHDDAILYIIWTKQPTKQCAGCWIRHRYPKIKLNPKKVDECSFIGLFKPFVLIYIYSVRSCVHACVEHKFTLYGTDLFFLGLWRSMIIIVNNILFTHHCNKIITQQPVYLLFKRTKHNRWAFGILFVIIIR